MSDKNTVFKQRLTLNIQGRLLDLSKPAIMGILNLTPDSFYQHSRKFSLDEALKQTEHMLSEGADFIDIGAYSSRPQAEHISTEEELNRLIPAFKAIVHEFPQALISIDTFRTEVARVALMEGAHLINDISGGEMDRGMFEIAAHFKAPYILMHMKGTPQNMNQQITYRDFFSEIFDYFLLKIKQLRELGVEDIIIDPGFGFAKTESQNYQLLNRMEELKLLGYPLLVGVSRKSMIHKLLGISPEEALNGTTVVNTIALMKGANILRVHDVKAAVEAVQITKKLKEVS
ncbi:MAG TPA: dihydropteroate synthase [Daejeonella sp.]|nr:dihydropteroate synthase [Daejeonella sp.]